MNLSDKKLNAITAMLCILLLTGWALYLGFDGILYMSAIAIISGLGGYIIIDDLGKIRPTLFYNKPREEGLASVIGTI